MTSKNQSTRTHQLPRAAEISDRRKTTPYVNQTCEREDHKQGQTHEQVRFEQERRAFNKTRCVATESDDMLSPVISNTIM